MKMKPPALGREPGRLSFDEPQPLGLSLDKTPIKDPRVPDLTGTAVPLSRLHESLVQAQAGIEQRIERLDLERQGIEQERRQILQTLSRAWVPDLSDETTSRLAQNLPGFVRGAIKESLDTRKFLGFFGRGRYEEALEHVRVAVVAALDQGKAGTGFAEGAQIDRLGRRLETADSNLRTLQKHSSEMAQISVRMQTAMERGMTELPENALPQELLASRRVPQAVTGGKAGRESRRGSSSSGRSFGASPSSSMSTGTYDDMTDFWIYYLTDVPVSGRTLLWSALDHHHGLDHNGAGASLGAAGTMGAPPPWAPDPTPAPAPSSVPEFDFSSSRALGDTPVTAPSPLLPDPTAGNGPAGPGLGDGTTPWSVPNYGAGPDPSLPSFDDRSASQADALGSYS